MRKSICLAVVVILAMVGLGLYLARSGRPASAQSVELDPSLVALLPADASTLVGVDVERLKRTTLYRLLEDESRKREGSGGSHFDDFTATTGFDPRRDVQQLLMASWIPAGLSAQDAQFVAVARGQFNAGAIGREVRKKGSQVMNYRGFEIFLPEDRAKPHPPAKVRGPQEQGAFVFLDDKTAAAGTRPALLAAIDRKLGGGPSLLQNKNLLARAQSISASSQVWAISLSPGDVVTRALPKDESAQTSNFARIFSSMQNSTFALDLMNGLELRAAGTCKTSQDAKTLGDAARGFVALGRLAASQKEPELMTLFDGIRVEERNAELDISVQLDQNTVEKLFDKTHSRKGKTAGTV